MNKLTIGGRSAAKIFRDIEAAIQDGEVKRDQQLPSVRELAEQLGVNRNTVAAAYAKLRDAGLIVGSGRQGSRVVGAPFIDAYRAPLQASARDLASGNVDSRLLPDLRPFLVKLDMPPSGYELAENDGRLLALVKGVFEADGIAAKSLAVTSGAMDALERALRSRLRPGDLVAMEDPCFVSALHLVRALGFRPVPMSLDRLGAEPSAVEAAIEAGAKAVVLTPRAQNPTGACFTGERAKDIRRILDRHPQVLLIEDDHASSISGSECFSAAPSIVSRPWLVIRSVSKFLGPDLRLSVLAGDETTIARISGLQMLGPRWVSHILQTLVWRVWSDAGTGKLIADAAAAYSVRRIALCAALAKRGIDSQGASGLHVWVPVQRESEVVQGMLAQGWAVQAGEVFRIRSSPGIRIGIADISVSEVESVAQAFERCMKPGKMRLI